MTTITTCFLECNEPGLLAAVRSLLEAGTSANDIVGQCHGAMAELGDRFDAGEAFIPELMMAGMMMKKTMAILQPHLETEGGVAVHVKKKLVIGTVKNDIHDIGKDITAMVFRSSGYDVIDLGVDVPAEKFVDAIRLHKPELVGMSLLLTTCYSSVLDTTEHIRGAGSGLRESVKLCVGGAAASPLLAEKAQCDFYGKTAIDALRWAEKNI